ncbi:MAG: tyrosine-type recombinase/integrase, partial [Gemmatimonadetes bacterium]|nr:tyrosine-type recombinase/integrase [Gemmatimonadota bacterium]
MTTVRALTAAECRKIDKPGFYRVADTLYLFVKKQTLRKSWVQRIVIDGKRRNIGLGSFDLVSISKAKDKALKNRIAVADGENPMIDKQRSNVPTFEIAARDMFTGLTFKNDKNRRAWIRQLEIHVFPKIGKMTVDKITGPDVLSIVKNLWKTKPATGKTIRQQVRQVLSYCQAHNYVAHNVAGEAIDGALPKNGIGTKNHRAIDYRDMPDAMKLIRDKVTSLPVRLCMQFIALTATRSNEARSARWSEIDFDSSTWIIPADRMKGKKEHRVPLSKSAMDVLEQAMPLRNPSDLIFPSAKQPHKPIVGSSISRTLQTIGLADKTTIHGFRSTFRT